jgi:hypothetical protein
MRNALKMKQVTRQARGSTFQSLMYIVRPFKWILCSATRFISYDGAFPNKLALQAWVCAPLLLAGETGSVGGDFGQGCYS